MNKNIIGYYLFELNLKKSGKVNFRKVQGLERELTEKNFDSLEFSEGIQGGAGNYLLIKTHHLDDEEAQKVLEIIHDLELPYTYKGHFREK